MIVSNINGIAMKAMSEKALNTEVKQLIQAIQYVFLEQRIPVFFLLAQTRPNKAVVLLIVMNTILWSCSYVSIWITPYIRTGLFSSH